MAKEEKVMVNNRNMNREDKLKALDAALTPTPARKPLSSVQNYLIEKELYLKPNSLPSRWRIFSTRRSEVSRYSRTPAP